MYVIQLFIAQEIMIFVIVEPSLSFSGACPDYLGFRGELLPFQKHKKGRVAATP